MGHFHAFLCAKHSTRNFFHFENNHTYFFNLLLVVITCTKEAKQRERQCCDDFHSFTVFGNKRNKAL